MSARVDTPPHPLDNFGGAIWPISGDDLTKLRMRSDYDGQLWPRVEESGRNLVVVNDWLCVDLADEGYVNGLGGQLKTLRKIKRCTCPAGVLPLQLATNPHVKRCAQYVEATA